MKKLLTAMILFIFLVSSTLLAAEQFKIRDMGISSGQPEYIPGKLLVKFRDGAVNQKQIQNMGCSIISSDSKGRYTKIEIPSDKTVEEMVAAYAVDPNVEFAEPVYIYRALMVPNDPYYVYQWHMPMINMEQAWDQNSGTGAVVAVIDAGVAYENYDIYALAPDLAQTNFVQGYDFYNNDAHPNDDNGHGTHVAGTIAQSTNNALGVTGIAYNCSIMPVKVLGADGSGGTDVIANGIYYAVDNGADVINMSLGSRYPSTLLEDACIYAKNNGVTIVCAAGNSGRNILEYPAAYPQCISVSSVRFDSTLAGYSTYNSAVDITAPGGDVTVDQDGDGYIDGVLQQTHDGADFQTFSYYFYQGTSMASPHVAGVAALLVSASGGSLTPDEIQTILQNSAVDLGSAGWDIEYGYGLLDANAALQMVTPSNDPPTANFSGTPVSGTVPLTVSFTDLSTNSPTTWNWSFGDGGTSTLENPGHTYTTTGTYTVSLTVSNAYGSDSKTITDYITVTEQPVGGLMYVEDITVTTARAGRNYLAYGTITIFDSNNLPLPNATVYATATGPTGGSFSGLTGADGSVTFTTAKAKTVTSEWCFEVTNVIHTSNTYESSLNNVSKACESGYVYNDGTAVELNVLPHAFNLEQNYPNPFNPTTEIAFSLPEASSVTLEVFNIKGQKVAILADGWYGAGHHIINFDAGMYSSGVYLYRLVAGENSLIKKMILLK